MTHQVSFQADTGDLLVEIDLPLEDVVPAARAYRYLKTRDEITPVPRPDKERKELYASVLAQTAIQRKPTAPVEKLMIAPSPTSARMASPIAL